MQWRNLSDFYDECETAANARDKQKAGRTTNRAKDTPFANLVGFLAEFCVGLEIGQAVDTSLRIGGNGGVDFVHNGKIWDIKGNTYWQDPMLRISLEDQEKRVDYYILVAIRMNQAKREAWGFIVGHATPAEVEAGEDADFGYGPRKVLRHHQLHEGLPT